MSDILFTCKIGLCGVLAVTVILLAGGFLFGGFELRQAVSVWRSGMCIFTGLLLMLVAGLILFKKQQVSEENYRWKARFKSLNYGSVMAIIAIIFILGTVIADYILIIM